MNNKYKIHKVKLNHPKPNFLKAKLIKLFEWILGGRFIDRQKIDKEILEIINREKEYNLNKYKYDTIYH